VTQTTTSDERGAFRFVNMQPGRYDMKTELTGFKTSNIENIPLMVDSTVRQNAVLELGGVTETVSVVSSTITLNTTDASLGNAISSEQIRSLPIEAQNVVQLLSLQPGAVFIPFSPNTDPEDPRFGAVAGSRPDQQNVTLDGVDVNDVQNQTAFTSAVRVTQEALQEFRVSTSNYNADAGRSSGPQVSLVTRSGTNQFDGSGYWTFRRTATSTNEFFLELSQKAAGQPSKPPKLDKDIFGGSVGGPIQRNRLFFFANLERLQEQSESPVLRGVPSNSFRDGVLMYQCASGVGRGVPGRLGSRLQQHSHGARGLVRHDPGRHRGPRSAAHRAQPRGVDIFQSISVAERARPAPEQHRRVPLRVADREPLLHADQPCRLHADRVRKPQVVRSLRQAK
jgi:hypothetical protein